MSQRTPTRRSIRTRGQPAVNYETGNDPNDIHWDGKPVTSRPTNSSIDFTVPDEFDAWNTADDEEKDSETRFYKAFLKPSLKVSFRAKRRVSSEPQRFSVGDTVFVSSTNKKPSIAVITGMWETDFGDDSLRRHVQIQWFIRPHELASIRAKRQCFDDEIYYSPSSTAVVPPTAILSHCEVTGPRNSETPPSSPCERGWKYVEENLNDDGIPRFQCRYAANSRTGCYYHLDWIEHHRAASRQKLYSHDGFGEVWKVSIRDPVSESDDDATPTKAKPRPKKARSTPKSKKTVRSPQKSRQKKSPEPEPKEDSPETEPLDEDADDDDEDEYNAAEDDDDEETSEEEAEYVASEDEAANDDDEELPVTRSPSKSRKRKQPSEGFKTPRKKKAKTIAHPTPHSKAALSKRRSEAKKKSSKFATLPAASYGSALDNVKHLPSDPWLRAMHVLHVGNRPDALPCRDGEFHQVLENVGNLLEEGSGGCIYISGVPGTGKTATVHAVIRQLKRMAEQSEINPFTYVEINGLRIPEPNAAYNSLWESLSGHDSATEGQFKKSPNQSLKELTRYFSDAQRRGPGEHACVVLMDELDQLMTSKQDVVYNFFNWPTMTGSKLVVIAVANTHDLPERAMTGRVKSRLGMTRINFAPYVQKQLIQIVEERLETSREGLAANAKVPLTKDGITFAAMKVAGVSGDARRMLDICRRTVESVHPKQRSAGINEVQAVIAHMQNSPIAAYLRECSFHERLMLTSLVKCIKREGVEEIKWGEVQHQHLIYLNVLTSEDDPSRKPRINELNVVLNSLVESRAMLIEDGTAAMRKLEAERKVVLNLEQSEVERVLGDIGGKRWKSVLAG